MPADKIYEGIMPSDVFDKDLLSTTKPIWTGDATQAEYPDEKSNLAARLDGILPKNHGFSMNPVDLLNAKLQELEDQEEMEERAARGEKQPPKALHEESTGERGLSYAELVSPLSSEEIQKQRDTKIGVSKSGIPKMKPEVHVFVFGGHDRAPTKKYGNPLNPSDEEPEPYDDSIDKDKYTSIMEEIFDGKAILLLEKVESIIHTSKFKILLKIARYVEDPNGR